MKKSKINKNGRPKLSVGEKKTYRINVKLATQEYYNLMAKVKNSNSRLSPFAREILKKKYVKERMSVEQVTQMRQLCGMANKLTDIYQK